jgi:hypothetical protein
VYTTESPLSRPAVAAHAPDYGDSSYHPELPPALDPALLEIAQRVYRTFFEVHPDYPQKPLGVVINQISLRGQLVFKGKPVLLIQECFIPIKQIES